MKRKHKNILMTVIAVLLFFSFLVIPFLLMAAFDPFDSVWEQDCYEDNHCREGLILKNNTVVTKQWCIEKKVNG